jgi:serine protease Do
MTVSRALRTITGWTTLAALACATPLHAASPGVAKAMGSAVADVVEQVMPSVVVVRTEATRYRIAQDWFFGQFYRVPERLAGLGSGVIITKDGYVLTNRHVVDEAQQIEVVFSDGSKFGARLVGEDPHTDLAVLKIEKAGDRTFQALQAGDSDALRVGEFVMAIGSPFSLSGSVTLGIVSQKGRAIGALPYEDFIQTDAAVNRGNSGGPLVDMEGRLVGINTMIQTAGHSEGNVGISFAIPINLAMNVAQSLMKDGKWRRPWIGIVMDDTDRGVAVARVAPDSPAARAGLQEGDVIRSVDGVETDSPRDVQRAIMNRRAGETVRIAVERNGAFVSTELTTDAMPAPLFLYRE